MELKGSLIIAEKMDYNPILKRHSISNILNSIEVPVLPSALITDVLVKFILPNTDYFEEAYVEVRAPDQEIVFKSNIIEIQNYRPLDVTPGMDANFNARFAVLEEGNYIYKLHAKEKLLFEYPLYVFIKR